MLKQTEQFDMTLQRLWEVNENYKVSEFELEMMKSLINPY